MSDDFKPGDRVRVQGFARDEKGTVTRVDHKGTAWYVKDGGIKARPIGAFEKRERA